MTKTNEFVTVEDKTYQKVTPYGKLMVQGREYFLLSPYPIQPDWENDQPTTQDLSRFVVVPMDITLGTHNKAMLYSYARHLVIAGSYAVEYLYVQPGQGIYVWQLPKEYDAKVNRYLTPVEPDVHLNSVEPPPNFMLGEVIDD